MKRPIFIIANNPLFFKQHLSFLEPYLIKYNVFFLSSFSISLAEQSDSYFGNVKHIPISRNPNPFTDFYTLIYFCILRLRFRPKKVISFTPKGGLVNSLSAFLPGRTYHYFTGQRWANFKGLNLLIFKFLDRLYFSFCDSCYCDSFSQSQFLAQSLNVTPPFVLSSGSVSGVDTSVFYPFDGTKEDYFTFISHLYPQLNFSPSSFLFGYVGRIHSDKGVFVLIEAFLRFLSVNRDAFLILVGPLELSSADLRSFEMFLSNNSSIHHIPFVDNPSCYYQSFSVFVLPSFREGFGSVLLEASASRLPIISSSIPGPSDFIRDNVNGLLYNPYSVSELSHHMQSLYKNPFLRSTLSENAYCDAIKRFDSKQVTSAFIDTFCL